MIGYVDECQRALLSISAKGRRMRSFRLDPDSVDEVVESWPLFLVALVIAIPLGLLAANNPWGRILIPMLFGVVLGPRIVGRLRRSYPTAKHLWLLSIGMMTSFIGVLARMAFPDWQGAGFDLTWLGIAFFTILAFVLVNRGNKDVV